MTLAGDYFSSYYGGFEDWPIFPVALPMRSLDPTLPYPERFDLTAVGQVRGDLEGEVGEGRYSIPLPADPRESAWFDSDADPATPSSVKLFMVGIANGLVEEDYVSRYDFLYARSYFFDPNTRLWQGNLLAWSAQADSTIPILNGPDLQFYSADDLTVTLPQGWSVIEIKAKDGEYGVRVYQTSQADLFLVEPPQFEDVDLTDLDYQTAFLTLLDELERTYVFTDYRAVDWEGLRQQFGPKAAQVRTPQEFQALLQAALFSFPDGHLAIIGQGLPAWIYGGIGLQTYPVEGELLVIEVWPNSPAALQGDLIPGTAILTVNDQPALEFFQKVPRMVSSGGHQTSQLWQRGDYAFRAEPNQAFRLTYRTPDGRTSTTSLRAVPLSAMGDLNEEATPPVPAEYRILEGGIGLVTIRNFTSSRIDDIWDDAMEVMLTTGVTGIIIDLRDNGGGFSLLSNYMLGDFLDEDLYAGREVSSLDEDGDGQRDIEDEFYYARQRVFDPARVVVLIGPNCYSACEFAAHAFQSVGATIIGHLTSGGAGGGVGASYFLPGQTSVYGMAVVRQEDAAGQIIVEGIGVPLDVEIPFTIQGLASGEDVLLQAAMKFIVGG
jgi:C-terminal processing protease CtpA/Prc